MFTHVHTNLWIAVGTETYFQGFTGWGIVTAWVCKSPSELAFLWPQVGAESSGNPHSSAHGGGTVVSYNYAEFVEFMSAEKSIAGPFIAHVSISRVPEHIFITALCVFFEEALQITSEVRLGALGSSIDAGRRGRGKSPTIAQGQISEPKQAAHILVVECKSPMAR